MFGGGLRNILTFVCINLSLFACSQGGYKEEVMVFQQVAKPLKDVSQSEAVMPEAVLPQKTQVDVSEEKKASEVEHLEEATLIDVEPEEPTAVADTQASKSAENVEPDRTQEELSSDVPLAQESEAPKVDLSTQNVSDLTLADQQWQDLLVQAQERHLTQDDLVLLLPKADNIEKWFVEGKAKDAQSAIDEVRVRLSVFALNLDFIAKKTTRIRKVLASMPEEDQQKLRWLDRLDALEAPVTDAEYLAVNKSLFELEREITAAF